MRWFWIFYNFLNYKYDYLYCVKNSSNDGEDYTYSKFSL